MSNMQRSNSSSTAVDDVRRVREKIADQHRGNIREHTNETIRIFEELRVKVGLKVAKPPPRSASYAGHRPPLVRHELPAVQIGLCWASHVARGGQCPPYRNSRNALGYQGIL